ncbi:hypothetical protein ACRAWD_15185 [Caulobacter segnis]
MALETLLAGARLAFVISADGVVTIAPAPSSLSSATKPRPAAAPAPRRNDESPAEVASVKVTAAPLASQPALLRRRSPSPSTS